jgi:secondary thiamine-phosphate synthase enzyme
MSMVVHDSINILSRHKDVFISVTDDVREIVRRSGVQEGVVYVITAHTTTGITVNEGLECLESDLQQLLNRLVPDDGTYAHARFLHSYGAMASNATSHQKAHLTGNHCVFPVSSGGIVLGHAQDIYLCEFDGPQRRIIYVTVMGES